MPRIVNIYNTRHEDSDLNASGIYSILNTQNNRVYIGQTWKSFGSRWREHVAYLRRGEHHNKQLQIDWNVFGCDSFEFSIIEILPRNSSVDYNFLERKYISATINPYNCPATGRRRNKD